MSQLSGADGKECAMNEYPPNHYHTRDNEIIACYRTRCEDGSE